MNGAQIVEAFGTEARVMAVAMPRVEHGVRGRFIAPALELSRTARATFTGFDAAGRAVLVAPDARGADAVAAQVRGLPNGAQAMVAMADAAAPVARPVDELVVQTAGTTRLALAPGVTERLGGRTGAGTLHVVRSPGGITPDLIDRLWSTPGVQIIDVNYRFGVTPVRPDTRLRPQWGLERIRAAMAWPRLRESEVPIAIIDSGIMRHREIVPSLRRGYDVVAAIPDDDPTSGVQHGTRVASVIAASHDDVGINGVLHRGHLMPVRAFVNGPQDRFGCGGSDTCAEVSRLVRAIEWAVANGARVVNASWGEQGASSKPLYDAIQRAKHVLFVVAGGLRAVNLDACPDGERFYPAGWGATLPNVLTVMTSNRADRPEGAYGARTVHLAAPGAEIETTRGNDGYGSASGTSYAVPFVTAAAALALATPRYASYGPERLRTLLIDQARLRPVPALAGKCRAGAVLDVGFLGQPDAR